MTIKLLNIWLFFKVVSYIGLILAVLGIVCLVLILNRRTYQEIQLDGKQYWFSYNWYHGVNQARLYRKRLLGYRCVSESILLPGFFSPKDYIKIQHEEGNIKWIA